MIRSINNNVAICLDSKGHEVVAFGKGIGFDKGPHEIKLSQVERTYYDVNDQYISMISDIPVEIFQISDKILRYAQTKTTNTFNSNIVFTLADHINFSIKRHEKNMDIKLPIINDVERLFELEVDIGKYGLKLINETLHIELPKEEAVYIALHIINAEEKRIATGHISNEKVIDDITTIIEKHFHITVDKEGFNYSRFVSHMNYLLKRGKDDNLLQTSNYKIYETLKTNYHDTYECIQTICVYLNQSIHMSLNDEEKIYLILHINRLCAREDCYR